MIEFKGFSSLSDDRKLAWPSEICKLLQGIEIKFNEEKVLI